MAEKKKLTLSVSYEMSRTLSEASGSRPAEYLEKLVRDARREWIAGLTVLEQEGWSGNEILAGCDSLHGCWRPGRGRYDRIPIDPDDLKRLTVTARKFCLSASGWQQRVTELVDDSYVSWHLWLVARAYWRGDIELRHVLNRKLVE